MQFRFFALLLSALVALFLLQGCGGGSSDDDDSSGTISDDDSATGDDSASDDDSAGDDAGDDTAADDDAQFPEPCPDGAIFDFQLENIPYTAPYPNDLYTAPDPSSSTGLRLHLDNDITPPIRGIYRTLSFLIGDAINAMDGFSTLGPLFIPLTDRLDTDSLPDQLAPDEQDSIFLLVADESSPHNGEFAPLTFEWKFGRIKLAPWVPLREKTHYLLVATRKVKPLLSECYRASASMRAIQEEAFESSVSARYEPFMSLLDGLGVSRGDVLAIADFTTLCATCGLNQVRGELDQLAQTTPPEFHDWQIESSGGSPVGAYATAKIEVPIFQDANGEWNASGDGTIPVDHYEDVKALFALPALDANPAGQPFPIVVFGHGTQDSKDSMRGAIAPTLAQAGFATAAIDAVCNGDRIEGNPGEIARALCYYDAFHILRWRDNIRESVSDYMWFIRALKQLGEVDMIPVETGGDGIPDFDVDRIYYVGHSLGSIHGGVMTAIEENVRAWNMSVAGADYSVIGLEGPIAEPIIEVLNFLEITHPHLEISGYVYEAITLLQNILDAGDPANFLTHLLVDQLPGMEALRPQVLQQGAAYDATLGGPSGAWYCRAGGWPQLTPFVWDVGAPHDDCPFEGSAFYQYDTDDHMMIHDDTPLGIASRAQMSHYFVTDRDTGTAEIIDPLQ